MRLLFIRHAEPDYSTDTLTEKGRREAALLAKAAPSMQLDHCFVSPLGRAQETASFCMKTAGMTAKTLDWLEEFDAPVDLNRTPELLAAYPNVKPEPPAGASKSSLTCSRKRGYSRKRRYSRKWRNQYHRPISPAPALGYRADLLRRSSGTHGSLRMA